MRFLSKACARFMMPGGDKNDYYEVKPKDLLVLLDGPDWLPEVPLFRWMEADGTVEVVGNVAQKLLELDPMQGSGADGKKVQTFDPEKVEKTEEIGADDAE